MATINKVRVGSTNYDIEDTTARANASSAQNTANSAQSTANGKADIANTVSAPWLRSVISDVDSSLTIVTASIRESNIEFTNTYVSMYWTDVTLDIPSECQPANGFFSVEVTANMLNNAGAITCVVMQYSKSRIIVRLINPDSGVFTFDLMIQALGF